MSADDGRGREPRTPVEWVTFGVSLALVAALAGLIVAAWVTGPTGPPSLSVAPTGPAMREGPVWRVPFAVRNDGGEAADQVQVVAELRVDGALEAEAEQVFEFLAPGETERGALLLGTDPSRGDLTVEVASYSEP